MVKIIAQARGEGKVISLEVTTPGRIFPSRYFQEKVKKIWTFIKEARQELKKVNWPSRKELIESTKVVIISSLLMILFIGVVDYVYSKFIKLLFQG